MPSPDELFKAWKLRPGRATLAPLLEATQDRVYNICYQVLRHRQDAEEAKQEVLLEMASGIGDVADAAHFERWVGRVAFRTALDRRRMRLRRSARELRAAGRTPNGDGPDDALHEGMSRLDDEERTLLIERYFDRRTLREMGDRWGISAVAVRKRIVKARERLKRMLGCAFPGAFWKSGIIVGASAMKAKTAAAIAIIVLPFLLLGGGVWVASVRQSPVTRSVATTISDGPRHENMPATVESDVLTRGVENERTLEPNRDAKAPVDPSRLRGEIFARMERIAWASRRAAECKTESREALSEEEGRRLQREEKSLKEEAGVLYREVQELVPQSPAAVVDLIKNARDLPNRWSLAGWIAPEVDAEIASENAPSGPLLAGLLTQAAGDSEDRMQLVRFAGHLSRANRELGQVLLNFMNDSDHNVRFNAAFALSSHAQCGNLREFLTERAAVLKQVSTVDYEVIDYATRGSALKALASLGTDDADDFVLQRFEGPQTRRDSGYTIDAMLLAASRIAVRHESRLVGAILRALDLPFQNDIYHQVNQLALYLPAAKCAEILRVAASKAPAGLAGAEAGFQWLLQRVESGEIEAVRQTLERNREMQVSRRPRRATIGPIRFQFDPLR